MAVLKSKDIVKMTEKEREEKLKELKQELIKANVSARKSGKVRVKEIKKAIARILTAQRQMQTEQKKPEQKTDKMNLPQKIMLKNK